MVPFILPATKLLVMGYLLYYLQRLKTFMSLFPTLWTIIPVIGSDGFDAIANAAGSVAGSLVVAASFGGEENHIFLVYL